MPDAIIDGKKTKQLPAATRAEMQRGVSQRKALATTTTPRSTVKVG